MTVSESGADADVNALPPLTFRHGEGVETESLIERAEAYQDSGLSDSDAISRVIADALEGLNNLEIEQPPNRTTMVHNEECHH